ncbi:MAG: sigma-70 family RNA polymerase sigma factor [Lachnospiraceae bacterium]
MTEEKDILKLVKKAVRGNVKAYGTLVEHYKGYLYKTAFLYTKEEDSALDIVQECVLKGFRTIKSLKNPEWFKTWLTRILFNTAHDFYQKKVSFEPLENIENTAYTKSVSTISQEEKWDLYEAIDMLPEKYRTVIILKYFDELKITEIASTLEIPEGSVSAYLTRAKQELKKYLKEGYHYA